MSADSLALALTLLTRARARALPAGPEAGPWGTQCLRSPDAFCAALGQHQQARLVLHGHLHTDMHRRVGPADVYCTPSTCHQTQQARSAKLGRVIAVYSILQAIHSKCTVL